MFFQFFIKGPFFMKLEIINEKMQKRLRYLTQGLVASGALNIVFTIIFIYFAVSDHNLIGHNLSSMKRSEKKAKKGAVSNNRYLNEIYELSFKELLVLLTSQELLEEGFTKRDLALGALYTFHYFNLEKALVGQNLQRRKYYFKAESGQMQNVVLFAGLTDVQFETVIHYGCSEKWPFTAKGLFNLVKKAEKPIDASLLKAFFITEEFYTIASLFQYQNDFRLTSMELLDLISSCSFSFISDFIKQQQKLLEVTKERRTLFLMGCLEEGSKNAASLLLKGDLSYLLKKASDAQLLTILSSIKAPSREIYALAFELIKSPRSNDVWQISASHLYALAREKPPEIFSRELVLKRFVYPREKPIQKKRQDLAVTSQRAISKANITKERKPRTLKKVFQSLKKSSTTTYTIKKGDSLWKIAHRHKVKVSQLMSLNNLKGSKVKPGQKLLIPKK